MSAPIQWIRSNTSSHFHPRHGNRMHGKHVLKFSRGFIFRPFPIFMDSALLNSQMLDTVVW